MFRPDIRVYVVTLPRRADRRTALARTLPDGLPVTCTADWDMEFDGARLSCCDLRERGITVFPWPLEAANPYWSREMTAGEIGCALAHLQCWRDSVRQPGWRYILVLEDDARLAVEFWEYLDAGLQILDQRGIRPGLIYAGRKPMGGDRPLIRGFVRPGFSYTTVAYLLDRAAVTQLLALQYERSLIPVDELLPAMYLTHPRPDVAHRFPPVLQAAAFSPEIVRQAPLAAVGSDTEDSAPLSRCSRCRRLPSPGGTRPG